VRSAQAGTRKQILPELYDGEQHVLLTRLVMTATRVVAKNANEDGEYASARQLGADLASMNFLLIHFPATTSQFPVVVESDKAVLMLETIYRSYF